MLKKKIIPVFLASVLTVSGTTGFVTEAFSENVYAAEEVHTERLADFADLLDDGQKEDHPCDGPAGKFLINEHGAEKTHEHNNRHRFGHIQKSIHQISGKSCMLPKSINKVLNTVPLGMQPGFPDY